MRILSGLVAALMICRLVKCWEIIAVSLNRADWSWGRVSVLDSEAQTIFVADAPTAKIGCFIVHADEKLSAFRCDAAIALSVS